MPDAELVLLDKGKLRKKTYPITVNPHLNL